MLVRVPGAVWDDYLNPDVSESQKDLGLPQPTFQKIGVGSQARYAGVSYEVALELAEYLSERADLLLAQSDVDTRDRALHNTARKTAVAIRSRVQFERGDEMPRRR